MLSTKASIYNMKYYNVKVYLQINLKFKLNSNNLEARIYLFF